MTEPKITKKRIPWKDREHLFTPANITKLEFICARQGCPFRKCTAHIEPKPLPHGPVLWIFRNGKPVNLLME